MSLKIITRCCYSCINCQVQKKICKLYTKIIRDIYKDKCIKYTERSLIKCEICGRYVVNLDSHVKKHYLTRNNYNAKTELKITRKHKLKERRLF